MPNNKKKKRARHRAAAAVFCAGCQKKLDPEAPGFVRCVCTKVNFCSSACQRRAIQNAKHNCPGAPSSTSRMVSRPDLASPLDDPDICAAWNAFKQETIEKHVEKIIISEAASGRMPRDDAGAAYFAKLADRGNRAYGSSQCAYMAGILYKNRMLRNVELEDTRTSGGLVRATTAGDEGVLETDELAYKYLSQASEAGLAVAMESLADMYKKGQGVRERLITGNDWIWRATLLGNPAGISYLDNRCLLRMELAAMLDQMEYLETHLPPGQGLNSTGPNLASLLACFGQKLMTQLRFNFPPFAADSPSLSVGNCRRQGMTGPVPVVGSQMLGKLVMATEMARRHGRSIGFVYGRRGVAKAATAMCHGETDARIADSYIYKVPPAPQCADEITEPDQIDSFRATLIGTGHRVDCVHMEGKGPVSFCTDCVLVATNRLGAVSSGSVAISLYETLPARGLTALWRDVDGKIQTDTFKAYSRGEAETALAAVVACEPRLAHPLFVAQDPNFLWPLITYHGTVRAALEYVAPHIDWNESLGEPKSLPEQKGIVSDAEPGKTLLRCSNSICTRLERRSADVLKFCDACNTRPYCSKNCMEADWIIHQHECSGGIGKGFQDKPVKSGRVEATSTALSLEKGMEVVVHGLKAKPQYNGKVGILNGSAHGEGRFPVKLYTTDKAPVLSIKESNIYLVGSKVLKKNGNKAKNAKCSKHKQEVCNSCCFDFSVVNHLLKLGRLKRDVAKDQLEEIAEFHFASLKLEDEYANFPQKGCTPECAGLQDERAIYVLKSLLEYVKEADADSISMEIRAAIAGLCFFSARTAPPVRPLAVKHLEMLLS